MSSSSNTSKNGTITSPSYPEPYPADIYCVYQFFGRAKERVQVIFTDFDLHLPHEPPRDCESVDALTVFITIDGRKERVDTFCGNKLPKQLMSNGPTMTIEFRSMHSSPEVKGFRAMYSFVTDFGITGGTQDNDSVCIFTFKSEEKANGTFTSPNYPGYYPRNTECHYVFGGKSDERVYIKFSHFDVDGIDPCTSDTISDFVEFSNFEGVEKSMPRHCGKSRPTVVESHGDYFRVTFKTNDKFDGTGFEAFYQFKNVVITEPLTVKRISTATNINSKGYVSKRTTFLLVFMFTLLIFEPL